MANGEGVGAAGAGSALKVAAGSIGASVVEVTPVAGSLALVLASVDVSTPVEVPVPALLPVPVPAPVPPEVLGATTGAETSGDASITGAISPAGTAGAAARAVRTGAAFLAPALLDFTDNAGSSGTTSPRTTSLFFGAGEFSAVTDVVSHADNATAAMINATYLADMKPLAREGIANIPLQYYSCVANVAATVSQMQEAAATTASDSAADASNRNAHYCKSHRSTRRSPSMNHLRNALSATAMLGLAGCTTLTEERPPANPQVLIDQRVAVMKTFGAAVGAATNQTQGKTTTAAARKSIAAARTQREGAAKLFPRGTALGDRGVTQSRALSTIFTNCGDFEAKFDALEDRFAQLDAALAKNAKAETAKALADARAACSACHNKYRAPED